MLLCEGLGGARLGTVWCLDFLDDDFVKREGRTMEAAWLQNSGSGLCVAEFGSLPSLLVENRHRSKS